MAKYFEMSTKSEHLEDRIKARMLENIYRYTFMPTNEDYHWCEDDLPEDESGYARIEAKLIDREWYFAYIMEFDDYLKEIAIPISEILLQRNLNLLDETSFPTNYFAYDDYNLPFAVETANGFETNIERAIVKACEINNLTFMGVRSSCGAEDILYKYGIEGIEISTLYFKTNDDNQDIIHILYVGKGTTSVNSIHKKCEEIIRSYGYSSQSRRIWNE